MGTSFNAAPNQNYNGLVATFTDPGNSSGMGQTDYSAAVSWGDGTGTDYSATIVSNGMGGFNVNDGHTYATPGSYSVTVTINDGMNSAQANSSASVAVPLTGTGTYVSTTEGNLFTANVADFHDTEPMASFTASVNWGDGTPTDYYPTITSDGTGGYYVQDSHTYNEAGPYTITVNISDTDSNSIQVYSSATVYDAALTAGGNQLLAFQGNSFTDTLAQFWDNNPNGTAGEFTATISWGDGSPLDSNTTIVPASNGGFYVEGTHTYQTLGSYYPTITINDIGGSTTQTTANITVDPAPMNMAPCSWPTTVYSIGQMPCSNNPMMMSASGVRYGDGVFTVPGPTLPSPGDASIPLGQPVHWTNGPGYADETANGNGTMDGQQPYLLPIGGSNGNLAVVWTGSLAEYFTANGGGSYTAGYYDLNRLTGGPDTFTLTDTGGQKFVFAGVGMNVPYGERGHLLSVTGPYGNTTNYDYNAAGQLTAVVQPITVNGTTTTNALFYSYYTTGANAGLVSNVALEREIGSGTWSTIRQVAYTYYDGTESYGNLNDLRTAALEDGAGNALDTYYYRYYTPSDDATGYVGGLQFSFDAVSYGRLAGAVGDPFTATDSQVRPYATDFIEYDNQQRVTQITEAGAGGDATGGLGTYTYSYTANPSNNMSDTNSWAVKTVEGLPNGSTNVVYTNAAGEVMLVARQDPWIDYYRYDALGRVVLIASPSAATGYNDSNSDLVGYSSQGGTYQYLSPNSGLITLIDYYSSTTAGETTPGSAAGYEQDVKIEQGYQGTPILQETLQYFQHTAGGVTVDPIATDTVYRNTDGTGGETTSYGYTWYAGTLGTESLTTTLPVISAAQNGPGTADVSLQVFDEYGNDVWDKDADGYINYTAYDPGTGAVTETIVDVNTADTGEFQDLPAGWQTPAGGGLNLVTLYAVDDLGRTTVELDPNGEITFTVYDDFDHEYRVYAGWNSTTDMPTGPTQVYRYDMAGGYSEALTMSATPHLTGGVPDGTEPIAGVQTLSRSYTNFADQDVRDDDYFNLSGVTYSTALYIGTQNVNYYTTLTGYASDGNADRTVAPTGTITDTTFDALDRPTAISVGTNDTPGSSNMVQTVGYQYDNGGIGDGNLTQETDYPGLGAAPRATQYFFDWRDRQVAEKDGVQASENDGTNRPIYFTTYDNLNEDIADAVYTGDGVSITTVNGVPQAPAADLLRAYSTTEYDDQGGVYQTNTFDVNPTSGAVSTYSLNTNYYYDHRGDLIATSAPGGLWSKDVYDGAGRETFQYTTDGAGGTTWAEAGSVANDTVLEQTQTVYDLNGNPIETIDSQRLPGATGTGSLGTPTSGVGARVYYSGTYYDLAGRPIADVNVGTNGGTAWVMPSTVPVRSDTVLVTTYGYSAAGFQDSTTDPMGYVDQQTDDALGRVTQDVQDYTDGTPTNDSNQTVQYSYDGDNNVLTVTAVQPSGGNTPSQTTQYVYGVTTASGSAFNSNDLLAATEYPDATTGEPSSSSEETYTYNALGQVASMTDRNGNTHQYTYDVLGRPVSDTVTTLGAGVDGSVRRIDTAYDQQGNAYLFTSYADIAGTTIVNQVERLFNGLGQLTAEYQSVSGAVNLSSTPVVQYAYTEMSGGQNNSRLVEMIYPNGKVLSYNYTVGLDSSISRLSSISDISGNLEAYIYLGLGTVVERDHPETGVNETLTQDDFGRIVEEAFYNAITGTYTDDFQYAYNRDGLVTSRTNALNAYFSESYTYNGLLQLTGYTQGDGTTQTYGMDAVGNITSVTYSGVETQTRTQNAQNEFTSISGLTPPAYDANGNLDKDPYSTGSYVYDAWNRLVKVTTGYGDNGTLAAYQYDALGRQVVQADDGVQNTTIVHYYNAGWQIVEDRVAGQTTAQNVWGLGTDRLVLRDSNPVNGVLTTRLYVQQDRLGNVTTVLGASGNVLAHFVYSPFGEETNDLDANWNEIIYFAGMPYRFQGMPYDVNTDLYQDREREYSPDFQTFLQVDPARFGGGVNFHAFVGDNPTNYRDPTGLRWTSEDVITGGLWGAVAALTVVAVIVTAPVSLSVLAGVAVAGGVAGGLAAGHYAKNQTEAAFYGTGAGLAVGTAYASWLAFGPAAGGGAVAQQAGTNAACCSGECAAAGQPADTVLPFGPHVEGSLPANIAGTFRGGSYSQVTLGSDTSLYRVYGGSAGQLGSYWSRTAPAGPLQSTIDLALNPTWGNTAQNLATIRAPAGTTIYQGFAAPQGGLVGGGSQVYIPRVNPSWISPNP